MASMEWSDGQPEEVVDKVLRRAEVARMARLLQTRLAFASFKSRRGWKDLDYDMIDSSLGRKRPSSSETISESSSTVTDLGYLGATMNSSSPSNGPIFSDTLDHPGHRSRLDSHMLTEHNQVSYIRPYKRARSISTTPASTQVPFASWKDVHKLPQSSPVRNRRYSHFPLSRETRSSFTSNTNTIPLDMSPRLGDLSDDDDVDLPHDSFHPSQIHSSPPRTPPPTRARAIRHQNTNASPTQKPRNRSGEEGADLLLFLATSPSPTNPALKARLFPPSTPPSRHPALPSSMMTTPSGGAFLTGFGGPNTPSTGFNFADFVNITPSPAQGIWGGRTPAAAKTPLAAREARRRLNFDALAPPSPNVGSGAGGAGRPAGLGMVLGGDLVS